jgi:hypothetical protein
VTHYLCVSLAEPKRVLGFESGIELQRAVRQGCDLIVKFVRVSLAFGTMEPLAELEDVEEGAPLDPITTVAAFPPYCEVNPRKLLEPPCQGELPQQLFIGCSITRKISSSRKRSPKPLADIPTRESAGPKDRTTCARALTIRGSTPPRCGRSRQAAEDNRFGLASARTRPTVPRDGALCEVQAIVRVPHAYGTMEPLAELATVVEEGAPLDAITAVAAIPPYCEVITQKTSSSRRG